MRSASAKMMRAVLVRQFGDVDQMKVERIPIPTVRDKQVLIKVHSSGVNPVDTYVRAGQYKMLPDLPYIPGKDAAGLVHSVGASVTKFKPGDRVFSSQTNQMGTLAEYACVDESNVFPLGSSLTFDEGAAIGIPYFTAYRALFQKALAKSGERLLIHGASGAVGIAATQIAKKHGMYVVGTGGTTEGIDLVRETGADEAVNHRDSNYIEKLMEGEKFDVILEMSSHVNLGHDLTLMNSDGRTVVIGCRGPVNINPRALMGTEGSIIGCALFSATPDQFQEIGSAVVKGITDGWVKPVIDTVFDLEKAHEAHTAVIHSKGAKGKLIVRVQE
ncbi:quinone oxidoreductase-like [Penaeus monodon]|uniref:quinone oxidoreductase-like n=1 Tax=Penaeus monodon TaxID=6687 RepID=UPI0018A721CB|nr:quinone oxidoreductase-like [Penaeus monodon]XP_037800546.1 quinone oxidoreductase-like [Penaeus monodon]XP_037800554.1 quinone oxidoreductase-like [Penaeus monodon]